MTLIGKLLRRFLDLLHLPLLGLLVGNQLGLPAILPCADASAKRAGNASVGNIIGRISWNWYETCIAKLESNGRSKVSLN